MWLPSSSGAAHRVQARAGLAGAAAFMQRSAALTVAPARRAERALAAAYGHLHAGAFDTALGLAAEAEAAAGDDLQRARVEQLRGQVDRASNSGREAPVRLLRAAKRLESLDARLARDTYLDAVFASFVAGRLAESGGHLPEVARAARSAPPTARAPLPRDLLLDGLSCLVIDGQVAAEPLLRRAVERVPRQPGLHRRLAAGGPPRVRRGHRAVGRDCWSVLSDLHLDFARASGALAPLSAALNARRMLATFCGDFEAATSLGVEEIAVKEATGARKGSYGALLLAAYYGRPAETLPLIAANADDAIARGEGLGLQHANWASGGSEQRSRPLPGCVARCGASGRRGLHAVHRRLRAPGTGRSGRPKRAARRCATIALTRLSTRTGTGATGTTGRRDVEARSRALLSEGEIAERRLRRSDRATRPYPLRPDLARAHLLYGEWLRRQGRRDDARHQLRAAYDLFAAIGAEAFAERARTELPATGENVRKREVDTHTDLTSQEEHIARLARDGRTNAKSAAELFLSARTVEWHLRKVFTKLGITSRKRTRPRC